MRQICRLQPHSPIPIDVEQQPNTMPRKTDHCTECTVTDCCRCSGPARSGYYFSPPPPTADVDDGKVRKRERETGRTTERAGQESHSLSRPAGRSLRLIVARVSDDRYSNKNRVCKRKRMGGGGGGPASASASHRRRHRIVFLHFVRRGGVVRGPSGMDGWRWDMGVVLPWCPLPSETTYPLAPPAARGRKMRN